MNHADAVDRVPDELSGDRPAMSAWGGPTVGDAQMPEPSLSKSVQMTREFRAWLNTLDAERQSNVGGTLKLIAGGGPTKGRPHVDVIHGSRLHKLKEARIDRGTRVLFAFDSNRKAIMLVGGDKTGKWNRWYPRHVQLAERLYLEHERNIGKEPRCLSPRQTGRAASQRGL